MYSVGESVSVLSFDLWNATRQAVWPLTAPAGETGKGRTKRQPSLRVLVTGEERQLWLIYKEMIASIRIMNILGTPMRLTKDGLLEYTTGLSSYVRRRLSVRATWTDITAKGLFHVQLFLIFKTSTLKLMFTQFQNGEPYAFFSFLRRTPNVKVPVIECL